MSLRSNPSSAMSPSSYTSPPFLDSSSSSRRPTRFSTISTLGIPPAVSPLDLPRRASGMSLPQGVGKMHRKDQVSPLPTMRVGPGDSQRVLPPAPGQGAGQAQGKGRE
jgi:hypothetical protein